MQGTYTDIQAMERNLSATTPYPVELTKVVDANLIQPKGPQGNELNGFEAFSRFWVKEHANNAPGNILISVLCRQGPESPLTDPVDVHCSGLKDFIAKHLGAGPTQVT